MDTGLENTSEINTFHNVCKSKISFTELYEFIRHIHECQFNFVKLYYRMFPVFLGQTSAKQWIKCLDQKHNTVTSPAMSLELATLQSQVILQPMVLTLWTQIREGAV